MLVAPEPDLLLVGVRSAKVGRGLHHFFCLPKGNEIRAFFIRSLIMSARNLLLGVGVPQCQILRLLSRPNEDIFLLVCGSRSDSLMTCINGSSYHFSFITLQKLRWNR